MMNPLQMARSTNRAVEKIESLGVTVEVCTDFELAESIVEETGRLSQTPMFSLASQDFTASEAFWLFAFDGHEAIGGAAARMIDLSLGERLDDYIKRTSKLYFGMGRVEAVAKCVGDDFKGRVVYLGELEFSDSHRGNMKLLSSFVHLLKCTAATRWPTFDWMFCYIPEHHVKLMGLYQFTVQIPHCVTWADPPPNRMASSHSMFAISRPHLEHVLSWK